MDDDGMKKSNGKIIKWVILVSSILIAAYIVSEYAS